MKLEQEKETTCNRKEKGGKLEGKEKGSVKNITLLSLLYIITTNNNNESESESESNEPNSHVR